MNGSFTSGRKSSSPPFGVRSAAHKGAPVTALVAVTRAAASMV